MKEAMQKKMEPTTVCRVQVAGFRVPMEGFVGVTGAKGGGEEGTEGLF